MVRHGVQDISHPHISAFLCCLMLFVWCRSAVGKCGRSTTTRHLAYQSSVDLGSAGQPHSSLLNPIRDAGPDSDQLTHPRTEDGSQVAILRRHAMSRVSRSTRVVLSTTMRRTRVPCFKLYLHDEQNAINLRKLLHGP